MTVAIPQNLPATTQRAADQAVTTTATGATGKAGSSKTTDTSVQFSSSDFMQLLVAEMKNQDPTQPTDPTQYVQQLVGVNSLQQLIQINEGINGTSTANTTH